MSSLIADAKSLVGSSASQPSEVPKVGDRVPSSAERSVLGSAPSSGPSLVAFVRHCGCPFAEKEVRQLADIHARYPAVQIHIVSHSDEHVVRDWFDRVGKPHFADLTNVDVHPDPKYALFNAFGIGQLGWSELFTKATFGQMKGLASEGITNTMTGEGSNRWLNSGGFAIDANGVIRWAKVAKEAADLCDYEEAVKTIVD